jgi:hypothetical protein
MAFGTKYCYIDSLKAIKTPKTPIRELLWLLGQSEKTAKTEAKARTNRA